MFWKKKNQSFPTFYRLYLERIRDEGFSDKLIALDMETTGLNPKTAEVLSFGSLPLVKRKILPGQEKHLFFGASQENKTNLVIHEIFSGANQKVFDDAIPEILEIIANHRILGHFVEFDIALLNKQLKNRGLPKIKNPSIDTLKLALRNDGVRNLQFAQKEDYTLYSLAKRFGIDVHNVHDALEDAYLTALVYLHIT